MISAVNPWLIAASLPYLVQGLILAVDEFVLHRRRGLERWERWGHPLDTATVLIVNLLAVLFPFANSTLILFICLCIFSCVFVTKDEWVHAQQCSAFEHWLHAVLFVIHPIGFASTAFFWLVRDIPFLMNMAHSEQAIASDVLRIQTLVLSVFMIYQLIYWNLIRPKALNSSEILNPLMRQSESADQQSAV